MCVSKLESPGLGSSLGWVLPAEALLFDRLRGTSCLGFRCAQCGVFVQVSTHHLHSSSEDEDIESAFPNELSLQQVGWQRAPHCSGISDSSKVPPGAEQLPKSPSSQCAPLVCFSSVVTDVVQAPTGRLGSDHSSPLGGPEGGPAAGSCCSVSCAGTGAGRGVPLPLGLCRIPIKESVPR